MDLFTNKGHQNEQLDEGLNESKNLISYSDGKMNKGFDTNSIETRNLSDLSTLSKEIMNKQDYLSIMNLLNRQILKTNNIKSYKDKDFNSTNSAKKLKFTKEEDYLLKQLVKTYGAKNWALISSLMPNRSPRQCRDRYTNYLVPGYIDRQWIDDEDNIIIEKYKMYGPQWTLISTFLEGRTPNSIKNRWKYYITKHISITPPINDNQQHEKIKIKTKRKNHYLSNEINLNQLQSNLLLSQIPIINEMKKTDNLNLTNSIINEQNENDEFIENELYDFLNRNDFIDTYSPILNEENDNFDYSLN